VALLGKHVWLLLHDRNKLWVQVLTHKYLGSQALFHEDLVQVSSYTWGFIIKAMLLLKNGFAVRVGKGEVSLWIDKWLDGVHLRELVDYILTLKIPSYVLSISMLMEIGSRVFCYQSLVAYVVLIHI